MAKGIIIETQEAQRYIRTLRAVTKRMANSFEKSEDMSFRKWINKHGPVLDELIEELGGKV